MRQWQCKCTGSVQYHVDKLSGIMKSYHTGVPPYGSKLWHPCPPLLFPNNCPHWEFYQMDVSWLATLLLTECAYSMQNMFLFSLVAGLSFQVPWQHLHRINSAYKWPVRLEPWCWWGAGTDGCVYKPIIASWKLANNINHLNVCCRSI